MKKIIFCLFLVCNISALIAQNNQWVKIKDTIAAYVIEFPLAPKKGAQDVNTKKGIVKMDTYTLETPGEENLIYMTSFTEYPKSFFENGLNTIETQNKVLENSVDGAVTATKGTLLSSKDISFNGYLGKDFKININGGGQTYIIRIKTILVGCKLYLTQVIYNTTNEGNDNAKRFFESLELINIKE